jgi:hypothetical protein
MKKIIFLALILFSTARAEYSVDDVAMAKKKIPQIRRTQYGWCSLEKATAIFDLILATEPKVCVEIGVFGGASLVPAAMALKLIGKGIVIGIDPWNLPEAVKYFDPIHQEKMIKYWNTFHMELIYDSYLDCLRSCELQSFVQTIRKPSLEAAQEIDSIDILHIDGNVGGDMPLRDVQLYLPKIKSGGYIWLNDAIHQVPAMEYLLMSCDMIQTVDEGVMPTTLFRKR